MSQFIPHPLFEVLPLPQVKSYLLTQNFMSLCSFVSKKHNPILSIKNLSSCSFDSISCPPNIGGRDRALRGRRGYKKLSRFIPLPLFEVLPLPLVKSYLLTQNFMSLCSFVSPKPHLHSVPQKPVFMFLCPKKPPSILSLKNLSLCSSVQKNHTPILSNKTYIKN